MTGYVRNDVANNIADGNIINASDLDGEFDAVQAAFNAATGHTHDGTTGEGAPITVVGPTQDVVATATTFRPKTDDTVDLGTPTLEFKDLYIDGVANIDSLVADTADINGGTIDNVTIGGATAGAATFTNITATGTINFAGATVSDGGTVTTVDINGGTIDGATIATSDITVGTGKTLDVSGGTLTLANDQISGDKIQGGTIGSTTITTLTSTTGNITTVNATTVDTTNIEVTNIKAKDGTASATIADSTGVMTVASSVLTTTDINGGTIDGVTIGGASAGAGTFTTLTATGNVTLGNAATDTVTVTADVASNLIPSADNTYDLGAVGSEWKDLYIDGTANIDSLVADTADINGGTIDGVTLGTNSAITELQVDNLNLNGNTISSTNTNGNITLDPNGTGVTDVVGVIRSDGADLDGAVVINESGADVDFRVESDINANALLVDGATGDVLVGTTLSPTNLAQTNSGTGFATGDDGLTAISRSGGQPLVLNRLSNDGNTISIRKDGVEVGALGIASGGLAISTNSSERLRIDSSGNLLVGTTDINVANQTGTTQGVRIAGASNIQAASTGIAAYFNKLSTDGALVEFRRSATTVGSIGAASGGIYFGSGSSGTERLRITSTGNVGIGTSSPATALDVAGTVTADGLTVDGTTGINVNGIYANVDLVETDITDQNTRLINSGGDFRIDTLNNAKTVSTKRLTLDHTTGDISFYEDTGTTPKFFWDASAERLGIGTSSVGAPLEVLAAGTLSEDIAFFSNSSGSQKAVFRLDAGGDGELVLRDAGNNEDVVITSGGNTYFNGGNVGIGTSSPSSPLHVNSSSANLAAFSATNGYIDLVDPAVTGRLQVSGNLFFMGTTTSSGALAFKTGSGSERLRITSTGNVGIGTSSPADLLHVNGNARIGSSTGSNNGTNGFLTFGARETASENNAPFITQASFDGAAQDLALGVHSGSGAIRFFTGASTGSVPFTNLNAERLRITSTGNVGINETAPDYKLDVNGTFGFTPGSSVTPVDNGDVVFELTNNTTLTVKAKGSDGVVRSGTIALS